MLAEGIQNKTLFLFGRHYILSCLALLVLLTSFHVFILLWISFSGWTLNSHGTVISMINCFLSHDHNTLCGFRVVVVTWEGRVDQSNYTSCCGVVAQRGQRESLTFHSFGSSALNLKIQGPAFQCLFFNSNLSLSLQLLFNPCCLS